MSAYTHTRRARLLAGCALAAAIGSPGQAQTAFQATGTVTQGNAVIGQGQVVTGGIRDNVAILTPQVVIDWTPTDTATGGGAINILAAADELRFVADPGNVPGGFTVLNRVIPNDPSRAIRFDGKVSSVFDTGYGASAPTGSIWFYSPGGIIAGATSRFDVGSLVLTANDIDTTGGGLFGSGNLNDQRGTIRFRGIADSRSFVNIEAGAELKATETYVALVAPRISHGGAISVNGSAALVAAESVDITIPMAGSLFDIAVSAGSKADGPGQTIFEHVGNTLISDPSATFESRRVYMLAVPKNDAITMLVSGSAGYDAASQVQSVAGQVILVAGAAASVIDDQGFFGSGPTSIARISGGNFTTGVAAVATDVLLDATAASSSFSSNVSVNTNSTTLNAANGFGIEIDGSFSAGVGPVAITATSGGKIEVAGNLFASSNLGSFGSAPFLGENLSMTVDGGLISVGGDLTISSIGKGGDDFSLAGGGVGGIVTAVVSNNGELNVGGILDLRSEGRGGESGYGAGGFGQGGGVSLTVASGGKIDAGFISVQSLGDGGFGDDSGGAGTGGSATLSVNGGIITSLNGIAVESVGIAGDSGGGGIGGAGAGGAASFLIANGGQVTVDSISVRSSAFGGDGGATGGAATSDLARMSVIDSTFSAIAVESDSEIASRADAGQGGSGVSGKAVSGAAELIVGDGASSASFDFGLRVAANARGGGRTVSATGGSAVGGAVLVDVGSGSFSSSLDQDDALDLEATAFGGFGADRSGDAAGGMIKVVATGGAMAMQGLSADASARTQNVSFDDVSNPPTAANGGNVRGGDAQFAFAGANMTVDTIALNLNGTGGNGGALDGDFIPVPGLTAGSGTGGNVSFKVTGGNLAFDTLTIDSIGEGGGDHDSFGVVSAGGAGQGGLVDVSFDGATPISTNFVTIDASAEGGGGVQGGAATGGNVKLDVVNGASLSSETGLFLTAAAEGGTGESNGGAATGGAASLRADGGTVDSSFLDLDAGASGGQAFSGGGAGGVATGGIITAAATQGGTLAGTGSFRAVARGGEGFSGSSGGNGFGGSVNLFAAGGVIDLSSGFAEIDSSGFGGFSPGGSTPATGRGGFVNVTLDAGGATDPATRFSFTALDAAADGRITDFSEGSPIPANGGTGIGGSIDFNIISGTMDGDGLLLSADGAGGAGPQGGKGGTGHQGRAALTISGGSVDLSENLEIFAEARGGAAPDETGYGLAGNGGDAGVGPNPFGAGAGAFVTVSGGSLASGSLLLSGDSRGGEGGEGSPFSNKTAGTGGDAVSGIAGFDASGGASIDISIVNVSARGLGGNGGLVEFGYGSSTAFASGGAGGNGSGGLATMQLASANAAVGTAVLDAEGRGGDGGNVRADDGSSLSGDALGGRGGGGLGGTATLTVAAQVADGFEAFVRAEAYGGQGGTGPVGGDGGDAEGGVATFAATGGTSLVREIGVSSRALGGNGAFAQLGLGGNGGAAEGGLAQLTIGGSASILTGDLDLDGSGQGGEGGDGGNNFDPSSIAGDGGSGGGARGGQVKVAITGGSLTFDDFEQSAVFDGSAVGGTGGNGGLIIFDDSLAGAGGAGGGAVGGSVSFRASGGVADLSFVGLLGSGAGGFAGADGGFASAAGSDGEGVGGQIVLDVTGAATSVKIAFLDLNADGVSESGLGLTESGSIRVDNSSTNPAGGLLIGALNAQARGVEYVSETGAGIVVSGSGGPIQVSDAVSLDARGPVAFSFTGKGGLVAGGTITVLSTEGVSVVHSNRTAGSASLSAASLDLLTDGDIQADSGSQLVSTGDITARAAGDAEIGSAQAQSLFVTAGLDGRTGKDATISGDVQLTGDLDMSASRDAIIGEGAQVIADRSVLVRSGDDIRIGANALLRAANDPPAESGYGSSDPREQSTQLRLLAGALFSGEGMSDEMPSLLVGANARIESPGRTMQLEAGAIQADPTSQLTAGNLFARVFFVPESPALDDSGQLAAPCLQGSICLGDVFAAGVVRIGDSEGEPANLRLNGGIDATDVVLRARDTIRLGRAGVSGGIKASDSLVIEAQNLLIAGPLAITGGASQARIFASGDIDGAEATIAAPGTLDLFAGNDLTLGGIDAALIRTVGPDDVVLNASGVTVTGAMKVGAISTASDLLLDGAGVATGAITSPGAVVVNGNFATVSLGVVDASSITADTTGVLEYAQLTASGAVSLGGVQTPASITGGAITAGAATLKAVGAITTGALTTTSGALSITTLQDSLTLTSFSSKGATMLLAEAGDITVTTDAVAGGDISATAKSVSITGANGLDVGTITATDGDASLTTTAGDLRAGFVTASGGVLLNSAGAVDFGTLKAGGALQIVATGNVSGANPSEGATVSIGTGGRFSTIQGLRATSGALAIDAGGGIESSFLDAAGDLMLSSANGGIQVERIASGAEITAIGKSVLLFGGDPGDTLSIKQAVATGGDVGIGTGGALLKLGAVSATGDVSLASDGGVTFDSVVAGETFQVSRSSGPIAGGTATAGSIFLEAAKSISAASLTATTGPVLVDAGEAATLGDVTSATDLSIKGVSGVTVDRIAATGPVTLSASAGAINIGSDITASGPIQATAQAMTLNAVNDLVIAQVTATGGDIVLTSANGGITIGQASASGALNASAASGTVALNGVASATTIAFTSKDIAIGANATLGDKTQTTALTLTSTADRMFLGDAQGTGYGLDNAEFARIATKGDVSLVSAPTDFAQLAFNLIDPAASNVVVGAMSFEGAQLGSAGAFTVSTPRSIGFTGNAQFKGFADGQTVTFDALGDIALAAESGLVTVKNGGGGLAGTLRLQAQQVHAMSSRTRSEIAGLGLNDARQRLGTNDQVENDGGYFQAGNIVVRIGRLAFIQNSGANGTDPDQKRGFTANSFTLENTGEQPAQVAINGRIGTSTGAGVIPTVTLVGSFDPASGFNGCASVQACTVDPGPEIEVFQPALNSSRDQIEDEAEEDEKEEALQASQTRPDPVIQFMGAPSSRFDPLIDEPVTGAGNEDLWLVPMAPSPGQQP